MRIELLKTHTHAGVPHAPGDIIDLDETSAHWLVDRGVAKPADLQPQAQPKTRKGD